MKALAIGIHNDDVEYGAGGTLALLAKRGWETVIVQIRPNAQDTDRQKSNRESTAAAAVLGARKIILDDACEPFYRDNDKTVEALKNVICEEKPDIIFVMHPRDNHIEHVETAKTTRNAIFAATVAGVCPNEIYAMEMGPLQSMCYFVPDLYIAVGDVEKELETSLRAFFPDRPSSGDWLWREKKVAMSLRGHEANRGLCEGLMIVKFPEKSGDFLLRGALEDKFRWGGTKMYYPMGARMEWIE